MTCFISISLNGVHVFLAYSYIILFSRSATESLLEGMGGCRSMNSLQRSFATVEHPQPVLPVNPIIMKSLRSAKILSTAEFSKVADFSFMTIPSY